MTPLVARRAPRDGDGILAETSDEDLLAWSRALLATRAAPAGPPVRRLRIRRRR